MDHNQDHTEEIERYLDGDMSAEESQLFRSRLNSDAWLTREVDAHKELRASIKKHGEHAELRNLFDGFHDEMDAAAKPEKVIPITQPEEKAPEQTKSDDDADNGNATKVVTLRQLYRIVAIAACFTLLLSVGGVYMLQNLGGGADNNAPEQLGEMMDTVTPEEADLVADGNTSDEAPGAVESQSYKATCFPISRDGYLITAGHIAEKSRDVKVQVFEDSLPYKADIVAVDPVLDVAILKIEDDRFTEFDRLPTLLKDKDGRLGQDVFTLGFPGGKRVYTSGTISSLRGSNILDTVNYQISVPLNPGNSGGPLLNDRGEIVGMVTLRDNNLDVAYYATKSTHIIDFVERYIEESEDEIKLSRRNALKGRKRPDQIDRLEPFVYSVNVTKDVIDTEE